MALTSTLFKTNQRLQLAANNNPSMRKGEADHAAVRILQEALVKLGYPLPRSTKATGFDGDYGDETYGAVYKFQVDKKLPPPADGRAGKNTLTKMDALLNAGGGVPAPTPANPKAVAETAKITTQFWVASAITAVSTYRVLLQSGLPDVLGAHKLTIAAVNAHFHLDRAKGREQSMLITVQNTFADVAATLLRSAQVFNDVSQSTAAADFNRKGDASFVPPPAYAMARDDARFPKHGIFFTPNFKTRSGNQGFGPNCLAAMVLHECVHFVDKNAPDFAYEHQVNPFYDTPLVQFIPGADYDRLEPEKAIHNPSSFASFAGHLIKGSDKPRFGAGNPAL
ncbi:MAG TPA: peptidoglycan-binding protein [Vicinamibacterales bacterium]|nr:peptidoglycan-binding protein [Vicinamibacterales bacterium]